MRCGKERGPVIVRAVRDDVSAVDLIYRGESIMQIRGAVTGHIYQFSPLNPVQAVDRRDAAFIVQTRLLRQVSCQ
jgi:hypothetical protein